MAKILLRAGANADKAIAVAEKLNEPQVIEFIMMLQTKIEEEAAAQAPDINQMIHYIKICGYCGKRGDGMLKCAGCETVAYCCRKCQKRGWRSGHREICKRIQREKAEAEATTTTTTTSGGSASSVAEITDANGLD